MDNKDHLTIKDASRLLGVSDKTIRRYIDRGALETKKGLDGRIYVSIASLNTLMDKVVPDDGSKSKDKSISDEKTIAHLENEIAYLKSQMEIKDNQLRVKDEQIQQSIELQKGMTMLMGQLQSKMTALPSPEEVEEKKKTEDNRGFWRRLLEG